MSDSAFNQGSGDARPFSLAGWRIAAVWFLITLFGLIAVGVSIWFNQREISQRSATAALAFVEARLDALNDELAQLGMYANQDFAFGQCPTALTAVLVKASIASVLAQQFAVAYSGVKSACGPEGTIEMQLPAQQANMTLSLSKSAEADAPIIVSRNDATGRVQIAALDSRAFSDLLDSVRRSAGVSGTEVCIMMSSRLGQRLAVFGVNETNAPAHPALRTTAASTRYDVVMEVDIDANNLQSVVVLRAVTVLLPLWFLTFLLMAWLYRGALLRGQLRNRISVGLRKRQFEPFVQPIVDFATGKCVGGEVLMRWNHPHRGIIAPGEFIEEAERSGLILGMADLVMGLAAHRLAPIARANPEMYFSFNVTPSQLQRTGFGFRLSEIFQVNTIPPHQVLLELTERDCVDGETAKALSLLKQAGWRIALDDFGTGQSSLAVLEEMRVDRIKIDRAFVSTIDTETVSRPVLDAIITLAKQLNLKLIAEGVETRSQWKYLEGRGVEYAQGYLISRPLAIPGFIKWLDEQQAGGGAISSDSRADNSSPRALLIATTAGSLDDATQKLLQSAHTPGGLDIHDRVFHLRTYRDCFIGSEAVDWIAQHQEVSREQAVIIGRRLLALGHIRHVADEHDFEDAFLFYHLTPPADDSTWMLPVASDLKFALRGNGATDGVPLFDHVRGVVRHHRCATGAEIVNWLEATYRVPRATAVQWVAQLMRQGVVRHVFDDQPFRDDRTLYRLT
jgi:sensor c-di-GMP phosphodiesterase-like protein